MSGKYISQSCIKPVNCIYGSEDFSFSNDKAISIRETKDLCKFESVNILPRRIPSESLIFKFVLWLWPVEIVSLILIESLRAELKNASDFANFSKIVYKVSSNCFMFYSPIPNWGVEHEAIRRNLIHDLGEIGKVRGIFKFSPQGLNEYQRHYLNRPEPEDEFEDERLRGYSSRKDIHTLKLAQILSLSDGDSLVITEREILGAIDAIHWLDTGLANVFAGHGNTASSEDTVRVFRQVEAGTARLGWISRTELMKRNFSNLNAHEFAIVIQTLTESGAIAEEGTTIKGHMEKVYKVLDRDFIKRGSLMMPKSMRED